MQYDEIPPSILKSCPKLRQIHEALASYFQGQPITTQCKACNKILQVLEVVGANSLWVLCGNGCTSYREKYSSEVMACYETN